MPGKSIIERIAAEREKKRKKQMQARRKKAVRKIDGELSLAELERRKAELENKIASAKSKPGESGGDDLMLDKIKAEIAQKKSAGSSDTKTVGTLAELVESGTKEDWVVYFGRNLKGQTKMEFPPIDVEKCKFPDYGYRRLIELMMDSEDFLNLIIDVKDVPGFQMVSLNSLIRGDEPTLRGVEALCNLLINKNVRYNPVMETDFKYLNIILDAFTIPKKDGINKIWSIKLVDETVKISASFDRNAGEWEYKLSADSS